jgi:short-subunit dehydrogenase
MDNSNKPTLLIFGYGENLGRALANRYLAEGYQVVGFNRSGTSELTSNRSFSIEKLDLAKEGLEEKIRGKIASYKNINTVIFNASNFTEVRPSILDKEIILEVLANTLVPYIEITKVFLPILLKSSCSLIVTSNGTSNDPWLKAAGMGISKAGLENYQKALALEFKDTVLKVATVKILSNIKNNESKECVDIAEEYYKISTLPKRFPQEIILK